MISDRLKTADWEVRKADLSEARRLVESEHYARGASNTAVYVHGLYRRGLDDLFGAAWWLPPTRVAAESVSRLEWRRVLALSRLVVAPEVPGNAASFLLGRSIRAIRRDGRFNVLLTYADEAQGHTGAIYRATNWTYLGLTKPSSRWQDPKTGRSVSPKATVNRTKDQMLALGYVRLPSSRKHKFVMHL